MSEHKIQKSWRKKLRGFYDLQFPFDYEAEKTAALENPVKPMQPSSSSRVAKRTVSRRRKKVN